MNATLWLRISAVISLLFTAGHTLGGRKDWSPMGDNEVLRAMKTVHFDVMGVSRSYHDFYIAFGYSLSVGMLLQTVLLWQLATIAQKGTVSVRPMIAAFVLATAASGVLAWRLIFPIPAVFSLVLTVCLVLALLSSK
jgi:hypothetical protein